MLEKTLFSIYNKFKLNFYNNIFSNFDNKETALTVAETCCTELIFALGKPTITDLSNFMGLSQPNTSYRINSLVKKGYVKKIQSKDDKREFYVELTDKFYKDQEIKSEYIKNIVDKMKERFSEEELQEFEKMLTIISEELIPENNYLND
jgi:DNA-binding MarR family transcriptional regulator